MSADLPIWPTAKSILQYCWRERALALRYALVPVIVLILLDVLGTLMGIDIAEDHAWQFVTAAATLLAFAPLLVTWYAGVVTGEAEARRRPMFTFGKLESAVVMTNVLVLIVVSTALLGLGGIVALVAAGVYQINPIAGQITAVILGIPAVVVWIMILTRLSITIAFAADGGGIGLRETWRITAPIAWPFTWIHLILGGIGVGIDAIATAAVGAGMQAAGFGGDAQSGSAVLELAVSATDTIFTLAYLLLATTLFGVVYRRLAGAVGTDR
jgi:hypothetical protein